MRRIILGLSICLSSCGSISSQSVRNDQTSSMAAATRTGSNKIWCGNNGPSFLTTVLPSDPASAKKIKILSIRGSGNSDSNVIATRTTEKSDLPTSGAWKGAFVFLLPAKTFLGKPVVRRLVIQPGVFEGKFNSDGKLLDVRYTEKTGDEKELNYTMRCEIDKN